MPEKQSHATRPQCGAKLKNGPRKGQPCTVTILGPSGKCRAHGGWAGAPKGNKNSLKTGQYESILLDTLDEDERQLFDGARQRRELALVEEEIGLITVRERRMLKRIADLKAIQEGMVLVEETVEVIGAEVPAPEERTFSDRELSEMPTDAIDAATGANEATEQTTKVKQKKVGTLGQIQAIETALTDIQKTKARLIDLKSRLKNPSLKLQLSTPDDEANEVRHGLSDDRRAAGLAALLDRVRERAAGQLPRAD